MSRPSDMEKSAASFPESCHLIGWPSGSLASNCATDAVLFSGKSRVYFFGSTGPCAYPKSCKAEGSNNVISRAPISATAVAASILNEGFDIRDLIALVI